MAAWQAIGAWSGGWDRLGGADVGPPSLARLRLVGVVGARVQRRPVIPERDVAQGPAPSDDEFGLELLLEDQVEDRVALIPGQALDPLGVLGAGPVELLAGLGDEADERVQVRGEARLLLCQFR